MPAVGVAYGPAGSAPPHPTVQHLKALDIAYVRIQWVDLTSNIRYRVLPITYFAKLLQSERPAVSLAKAALGLVFLSLAETFAPVGEYSYVFDLDSCKPCSYAPGHASIMGWFQEKFPAPGANPSYDVDICPRALLRRIAREAKSKSGVDFLVGFETEFVLVNKDTFAPVNQHGWSCSPALYTGSVESAVLEEIADALGHDGVELQMYHAEGAPGQYEVVTGPLPPLQAADALTHTRETIYNIANKHGLRATLAPRIFGDSAGSGTHVHISVRSEGLEEAAWTWDGYELRPSEASFLAGLLSHLPALCAFTLPFSASYGRIHDGIWSGGTYACWGVDHRETPLRLCNHASPSSRNFELRMLDGTSSPYLALAAILGAGWAGGINVKKLLAQKPITAPTGAYLLEDSVRASLGIDTKLPRNVPEAHNALNKDDVLPGLLGEGFVNSYLSVNRHINQQFDLPDPDQARRLLITHY